MWTWSQINLFFFQNLYPNLFIQNQGATFLHSTNERLGVSRRYWGPAQGRFCGYPHLRGGCRNSQRCVRVRGGSGAPDKNFFVGVTGCWLNACESEMSKKFNVRESLWCKGVETFSPVVATGEINPCRCERDIHLLHMANGKILDFLKRYFIGNGYNATINICSFYHAHGNWHLIRVIQRCLYRINFFHVHQRLDGCAGFLRQHDDVICGKGLIARIVPLFLVLPQQRQLVTHVLREVKSLEIKRLICTVNKTELFKFAALVTWREESWRSDAHHAKSVVALRRCRAASKLCIQHKLFRGHNCRLTAAQALGCFETNFLSLALAYLRNCYEAKGEFCCLAAIAGPSWKAPHMS